MLYEVITDYLQRGYYPFGIDNELEIRLGQVVVQTLEIDIPQYANMNVSTSRKLKRLLSIISESVPFKPNMSKIAEMISVSRNSLDDYFAYMEKAGLIGQLRNETSGIKGLGKVDNVITSYSIHYTKLYEFQVLMLLILPFLL